MTILEALKSRVQYPLGNNFYLSILIERGLDGDDEYNTTTANSKEFKGARADCLIELVTTPTVSEGGMSINVTDKASIIIVANKLYDEIGESLYGQPTVTVYYE